MPLTPRQAFKFGFLLRCADENLNEEQTQARIKLANHAATPGAPPLYPEDVVRQEIAAWQKQAFWGVGDTLKALVDAAGKLTVGTLATAGGVGFGAGAGLAQLTRGEADPEELKKRELIAAYKQQAENIRRQMAARSYRQSDTPRPPKFGI